MASKKSKDAANLLFFAYTFLIEVVVLIVAWVKGQSEV